MTETRKEYPLTFRLMLWAIYILLFILKSTWRVRIIGMDRRRMATDSSPTKSFLLATWHENASAGVLTHPGQNICVMVSRSKDGEIVDFIARKLGLPSVRGSSSRGSKEVRDGMMEAILAGASGAITVDGPRGPRRVPKNGVVDIARKTGVPVIPITCVGESTWVLRKTWDQTRIPKPFSRVIIHYGQPIKVPKDTQDEHFKTVLANLQESLNRDDDLVNLRFDELWRGAQP